MRSPSTLLYLGIYCLLLVCLVRGEEDESNIDFDKTVDKILNRAKRQYYGDDVYGSYYGWQAGRIMGWVLGFIVLLLVICVPCVCCIGIWFAGWFGLRQAMAKRQGRAGLSDNVNGASSNVGVIRRVVRDDDPVPREHRVVYATATDRYFERRPETPPRSSSAHYLPRRNP